MTDLEAAFEESRRRIADGEATVEDCLARYPDHAEELARLLRAAASLQAAPQPELDARAKARVRARLTSHMRTHPRRRPGLFDRLGLLRPRWATALSGLLLALVLAVTTFAAQAAGPGDMLYPWRLAFERMELVVSSQPDKIAVEIARQRLTDLLSAQPGSAGYTQASAAYRDWIGLLDRDGLVNSETAGALAGQLERLRDAGIQTREIEQALRQAGIPSSESTPITSEPTPTSTPNSASPLPTLPPLRPGQSGQGLPGSTLVPGSFGSP